VISVILAVDPAEAVDKFDEELDALVFLDTVFKECLVSALKRYNLPKGYNG
jgi:hypothetical protein